MITFLRRAFKRPFVGKLISIVGVTLFLSACQSTSTQNVPLLVGPQPIENPTANNSSANAALQNAEVFLDVAVPVFDPGFPTVGRTSEIDYEELDEEGIWPQLRRTEAKLFAVETKNALVSKNVFGSVTVVPDASTPSDLFVLGKINHSDSEIVGMSITVVDSSGEIWGSKDFAHEVSQNYFRDQRNKGKNPYQPIYDQASAYVVSLLSKLSENDKRNIKNMSLMRYARYYSPEAFDRYLSTDIKRKNGQRYYKFELTSLPDADDPMLKRIQELKAQELLFIDRLQDQYDVFDAEVGPSYATWQQETLPEIEAARAATRKRNASVAMGVGLGVLAAILAKNSGSTAGEIGTVVGAVGAAVAVNEAFKSNSALKVHSAVIEEKGQAVDLSVGPIEMEFEDQTIELQGTASEQYLQWKTHLREIYQLESTPDVQL
ncbi:hypothetical protein [Glaciecola sp. XM2]|uniref:hypothetical protein n=1 Tax=Glaciecola sp. XM2 TaxID=1914931 RepID=UPI002032BC55|nr:hypothetical protein [Glaciecola sp. XM2]